MSTMTLIQKQQDLFGYTVIRGTPVVFAFIPTISLFSSLSTVKKPIFSSVANRSRTTKSAKCTSPVCPIFSIRNPSWVMRSPNTTSSPSISSIVCGDWTRIPLHCGLDLLHPRTRFGDVDSSTPVKFSLLWMRPCTPGPIRCSQCPSSKLDCGIYVSCKLRYVVLATRHMMGRSKKRWLGRRENRG
ncbi:hypothetical protein BJ742DRAFT_817299 [Cladochytrium replicatum]|nr:hypothetical protein BJ742DRAFT_817299 [Cladochytrium replicatum]